MTDAPYTPALDYRPRSERVRVEPGDCLEVMRRMVDAHERVHAVVTDPPYHLVSIHKRFAKTGGADRQPGTEAYGRLSRGFMGKAWDGGDVAFRPETWRLCYELLPPGGHLLAFSGTRTYHRMACAIEDAGFEIRDQIGWAYGTGFPKSHNQHGDWEGWGTALKPAWEPICMARKPLDGTVAHNLAKHGVGAINIDDCRIHAPDAQGGDYVVKRLKPGATLEKTGGSWRPDDGEVFHGSMKAGRWPANIAHDGSDEVGAAFPDAPGQQADAKIDGEGRKTQNVYGAMKRGARTGEPSADRRYTDKGGTNFAAKPGARRGDSGSALRFFYMAKAGADDRFGSKHPTVKPVALMAWLCRLVTPPGGTVLDPFAGAGSTGIACLREGFDSILIEREEEYLADIRARVAQLTDPNAAHSAQAKGRNIDKGKARGEDTPLFGVSA